MIQSLTSEQMQEMMKENNEADYLIVDVRQPEEYHLDHVPGSVNIPLDQVRFDPFVADPDRMLVFCCRHGVRSKVAALFAEDAGHDQDRLYHLEAGLEAYSGEILLALPRTDLFDTDASLVKMMETAIELEKGAFRFYSLSREKSREQALHPVFEKLAGDETAHARSVFNQMQQIAHQSIAFEDYFEHCSGRILEGGQSFDDAAAVFDDPSVSCMDLMELAVEIEYTAYDLYRTMAETAEDESVRGFFLRMAQAEKKHLEALAASLDLCAGS